MPNSGNAGFDFNVGGSITIAAGDDRWRLHRRHQRHRRLSVSVRIPARGGRSEGKGPRFAAAPFSLPDCERPRMVSGISTIFDEISSTHVGSFINGIVSPDGAGRAVRFVPGRRAERTGRRGRPARRADAHRLNGSRGTEIILNNIGDDVATYRISVELRRMTPDGMLHDVTRSERRGKARGIDDRLRAPPRDARSSRTADHPHFGPRTQGSPRWRVSGRICCSAPFHRRRR